MAGGLLCPTFRTFNNPPAWPTVSNGSRERRGVRNVPPMELIRRFTPAAFARGLEDWGWLIGERNLRPLVASVFGDVFMQNEDGVWFLDLLEGALTLEWASAQDLQAALTTAEGQDKYLLGGIALGAEQK